MKDEYNAFDSTRLQMSPLVETKYSADYEALDPAKTIAQEKPRKKSELLEQLAVVKIGLEKSLKLRQSKDTMKKLGLLEELKRRVEASPDNIHISFDLYSPPIHTRCRLCVTRQPHVEVRLENQLTEALTSLGTEEKYFNDGESSSGSSLDTASNVSGQETRSSMSSDNDEVTLVNRSGVQHEHGPIDICISGTNRQSKTDPEISVPTNHCISAEESGSRTGGILLRHTNYGNDIGGGCCTSDARRERRSRSTRNVSFCNKRTVHFIDEEPTLEDKLAKARGLINCARTSRKTLASVVT